MTWAVEVHGFPRSARAAEELARVGGRAPAAAALTPAEQRVAELVAEGRTNREVASALFLTEHTIESHLRRVYRKFGVRSRTQLARRLWWSANVETQENEECSDAGGQSSRISALDARLWAARARDELARVDRRAPAAAPLTPAEQRVAELVAEGRTNREVASALFLTEHTVESYLRRVYRKLRVRSRTQLALLRLSGPERDATTAAPS